MPDRATTDEPLPLRLPEGAVLGRFVVDGWVRDGGMAGLYRGRDTATGTRVAIKVQLPASASDPLQRARFDREVDVTRRLAKEPHMVRLHDDGELGDGRRYLVSDWLEGENLEELLDRLRDDDRHLEIARIIDIARELAIGLRAMHRHHVVHRDLKPANIMVAAARVGGEQVKIVDFGISADLASGGHADELTSAGMVLGTGGYMAPEQAAGVAADPSFDVYAFGAVLYEAVTGARLPPSGWSSDVIASMTKLRPKVPPPLARLIAACLEPVPARRPEGAQTLIAWLEGMSTPSTTTSKASAKAAEEDGAECAHEDEWVPDEAATRSRARPRTKRGSELDRRWLLILMIPLFGIGIWRLLRPLPRVGGGSRMMSLTTSAEAEHESVRASEVDVGSRTDHASTSNAIPHAGGSTGKTRGMGEVRETSRPEPTSASDTAQPRSNAPSERQTSRDSTRHTENRCARIRSRATSAASRGRWNDVLLHTQDDVECWMKRTDRVELRVQAQFNLGEYARCIREGRGAKDPRVQKFLDACRARLHEPSSGARNG